MGQAGSAVFIKTMSYLNWYSNISFYLLHNCKLWWPGTGGSKIPWQRAKVSLSDVEFEKIFLLFFLSIPLSSDCKKPFRGFLEILLHNLSYEFTSFSIFWQNQKFRGKKYSKFQRHFLLTALDNKKICACAQRIFWFCFFGIAGA